MTFTGMKQAIIAGNAHWVQGSAAQIGGLWRTAAMGGLQLSSWLPEFDTLEQDNA